VAVDEPEKAHEGSVIVAMDRRDGHQKRRIATQLERTVAAEDDIRRGLGIKARSLIDPPRHREETDAEAVRRCFIFMFPSWLPLQAACALVHLILPHRHGIN
jgi:hypothetical protein